MAFHARRIAYPEYPWVVMVFMHFFSPDLLDTVTKENHGLYILHWPEVHANAGSKNGLVVMFMPREKIKEMHTRNNVHENGVT